MAQNIFAQYLQPPASINDRMAAFDQQDMRRAQLENTQGQNALLALTRKQQMDASQLQDQDREGARVAAQQAGGDPNKLVSLLRASGSLGRAQMADTIEKGINERLKTQAEVKAKDAETLVKHLGLIKTFANGVLADPSPQNATLALDSIERLTGLDLREQRQMVAQLQTPAQARRWAAGHVQQADKLLPQIKYMQTGKQLVPVDENTLTNPNQVPLTMTSTPGEDLTDRRTRDEGAANRNVQMRGQNMVDGRARDRMDFDKTKSAEDSREGTSPPPALGLPRPAVLPWANQTNPRDANKVKATQMQNGAKEVEKDFDAAKVSAGMASDAARFLELNGKVYTGGITDKFGPGRFVQSMGSDYSEMESITAKLAPAMRQPGSGATSDFDGKQFERATMGVDKPKKANVNIGAALIARSQIVQDYAQFRQSYLEQNGTLSGADRYWKKYSDDNPIFAVGGKDFALNKERKPYQQYFSGTGTKPPAAPPAQPPKPGTAPGGVIDFSSLK